ncbi:helix-turn-helix domain-containing protein [Streptomyces sp. SP18CS02]|uniref:helix-turn-helix domain-containing protein n=1 Tax=Streptomyces sp. SP18CS02 TaxID=3002531 RepID=UPI002E775718|nr:helix-turn-helix domain-containing protein [Streptomyces sp. SP18CS02]MEE1751718.1 helix-turn-helix domain-containing protein [Streptomyces sp. SP18CS02]
MDTQHFSAPPHAPSAVADRRPAPVRTRTHGDRRERHPYGVRHDNTRHTTRFTVVGNHLVQHPELSLTAIGLAAHIQSLPTGTLVDIRTLTARFPEGADRIAGALRELEVHGYLRRVRERLASGLMVTRTISCNQPGARRTEPDGGCERVAPDTPERACPPGPPPGRPIGEDDAACASVAPPAPEPVHAPRREAAPLRVPRPAFPAASLLASATALLSGLHRQDPRLLLSARDAERLAPGVAAWLERDVSAESVRHALTADLPPEGVRRAAGLLAHRLTALLPPPPAPRAAPAARQHPLQNCERCDRAFRAPEPGECGACRALPGDADRPLGRVG